MKRLSTIDEFAKDNSLVGSDVWILTKYQKYVEDQRFKTPRDNVSSSYYLYGVEAIHFNVLVTSQESFVSVRQTYLESVIRQIQMVDMMLRDDERLRACWDAQKWCDKMNKELEE